MFILFMNLFSFALFDLKSEKQAINDIRPKNEQDVETVALYFSSKAFKLNKNELKKLEKFALKNKKTNKKFQIISYINRHQNGKTQNELLENRVNIVKKYLIKNGMHEECLTCEVKNEECLVKVEKAHLNDAVVFVFEKQGLIEVLN